MLVSDNIPAWLIIRLALLWPLTTILATLHHSVHVWNVNSSIKECFTILKVIYLNKLAWRGKTTQYFRTSFCMAELCFFLFFFIMTTCGVADQGLGTTALVVSNHADSFGLIFSRENRLSRVICTVFLEKKKMLLLKSLKCNFLLWTPEIKFHSLEMSETDIWKPGQIKPKLSAWLHTTRGKWDTVFFHHLGELTLLNTVA